MGVTRVCHLNIRHDDSEATREALRVWAGFYGRIEEYAKKTVTDPIIDGVLISREEMLTILVTGRDAFLAIYNRETKELSDECDFEKVKYLPGETMGCLYERVRGIGEMEAKPHPGKLAAAWGRQVVKTREKEATENLGFEERMARARTEANLRKLERGYGAYAQITRDSGYR